MSSSPYTEQELEEQGRAITKPLYLVLLPILGLTILLLHFYEESDEYHRGQKLAIQRLAYKGIITKKQHYGGNHPRYAILESGMKLKISSDIYKFLSVGDSIHKTRMSDSVFYFTKSKGIIIFDLIRNETHWDTTFVTNE